jgi:hypothetical protein
MPESSDASLQTQQVRESESLQYRCRRLRLSRSQYREVESSTLVQQRTIGQAGQPKREAYGGVALVVHVGRVAR